MIQSILRKWRGLFVLEMINQVEGIQAVKCSRTDISGLCWEYHPSDNIMVQATMRFSDDMKAETDESTNQSQIVSKSRV
jgi:hypothetical protein